MGNDFDILHEKVSTKPLLQCFPDCGPLPVRHTNGVRVVSLVLINDK